jgi:hypothetical protein
MKAIYIYVQVLGSMFVDLATKGHHMSQVWVENCIYLWRTTAHVIELFACQKPYIQEQLNLYINDETYRTNISNPFCHPVFWIGIYLVCPELIPNKEYLKILLFKEIGIMGMRHSFLDYRSCSYLVEGNKYIDGMYLFLKLA